jgi:hypothetical protein
LAVISFPEECSLVYKRVTGQAPIVVYIVLYSMRLKKRRKNMIQLFVL